MATKDKEALQKRTLYTRDSLIQAGGKLFAEHGFAATSVRDICRAADANIAAVHYHFGDKQGLYEEILKFSFFSDIQTCPDPVWENSATPAAYLEELIVTILTRMRHRRKNVWHMQLARREMLFPSEAFQRIIQQLIEHDFKLFLRALNAINPEASEDKVRRALLCVSGQIGAYTFHPEGFLRLCYPKQKFDETEARDTARHITHFVVSGLNAAEAGGAA
ncbi:MAG: CerR family C-terminal domain-containing protein [Micavibrio sp.]|nr:CerR family C-terminal domain-containing protein [Micavibrio sp.]